jgi:putative Mg2+ transporter-C (MgtC) family protein
LTSCLRIVTVIEWHASWWQTHFCQGLCRLFEALSLHAQKWNTELNEAVFFSNTDNKVFSLGLIHRDGQHERISRHFFRLSLALLVGIISGLNRWIRHRSVGIRTHSLVALGAALVMLLIESFPGADVQASSRVLQGLITGIGFLGAGVIVHQANSSNIHGLTTAASLWACAILGATFGSGFYVLGVCALSAILLVLIVGGPLEQFTKKMLGIKRESEVAEEPTDQGL